jgi:uncharacterized Zn finger protein
MRWAGGRLLAIGHRIAKDGRVREMVRSAAGEVFATVVDSVEAREHFAGVLMEVDGKRRSFSSLCSCERAPCAHGVAVALALRAAVQERRTPPRMAKDERRLAKLPRPERTRIGCPRRSDRKVVGWLPTVMKVVKVAPGTRIDLGRGGGQHGFSLKRTRV